MKFGADLNRVRRKALTSRAAARLSRTKAVLAPIGMAILALALAGTTAFLIVSGLAAGSAGNAGTQAGQLRQQPPAVAGNLPRQDSAELRPGVQAAMTQFRQRFAAVLDDSTASYPAGVYAEPGRADPTTGGSAWVLYLGFNSPSRLGKLSATVNRLMASLSGSGSGTDAGPWRVAAGPAGGVAQCVITVIAGSQMSVCGWATPGAIGAIMSPARDIAVSELAALLSLMRPSLQAS